MKIMQKYMVKFEEKNFVHIKFAKNIAWNWLQF